MAPEVALRRPSDQRSDVYSLGCLAWHCLTGFPPFRRATAEETLAAQIEGRVPRLDLGPSVDPEASERCSQVFAMVLNRNPARRFSSPLAFANALDSALRKAISMEVGSAPPLQHKKSRGPLPKAAGAAAVMACIGGLVALVLTGGISGVTGGDLDDQACRPSPSLELELVAKGGTTCAVAEDFAHLYRESEDPNEVIRLEADGRQIDVSCANREVFTLCQGPGFSAQIRDRGLINLEAIESGQEVTIPSSAERCREGVYAAGSASCLFAINIARSYRENPSPALRDVYSPVTGLYYEVGCQQGDITVCRGSRTSIVYID
jgi:hypothetical protein